MNKKFSGIAIDLDKDIINASLPLFSQGSVECIEWAFDTLIKDDQLPVWFFNLLQEYSKENRLIGHGIFYSLFAARWTNQHQQWIEYLKELIKGIRFNHVTEHFGFMTGSDFHHGAPLPIPFNDKTLTIGIDRLKRLADTVQCPVGVENLAFSFSPEEVKVHGEFLQKLVEPVNGFIILDLHNFYCQYHNFQISPADLVGAYPLDMVKEIHISGGSWDIVNDSSIRRDTHDDTVPDEVFSLLENVISKCPNVEFVIQEQLGSGLQSQEAQEKFRADFHKMKSIADRTHSLSDKRNRFLLKDFLLDPQPLEDEDLFQQQQQLVGILENSKDAVDARQMLYTSNLYTSWKVNTWDDDMLETAIRIANKWKQK